VADVAESTGFKVKAFDEDLEFYQTTYEQPLLTKEPSLNEALAFVYNVVKEMA
jgi:hypothetical protein